MATSNKKMEMFIRREATRNRDTALESFQLRSAAMGKKGSVVNTFPIPSDFTGDYVSTFVDDIMGVAQDDADGSGPGRHRYVLVALEVEAKDGNRLAFALKSDAEDDDEGDGHEAPTLQGLVQQQMRHNEALTRLVVLQAGTVGTQLARQLEQERDKNAKLHEDRSTFMMKLEEMHSEQHERDIEMLKISNQEDLKQKAFNKLDTLFPLLINKISGQKALPEGDTGNILKTLLGKLRSDPSRLQKLAGLLDESEQLLLLTLIKEADTDSQVS